MSESQTGRTQPKKETSGIWVLLGFVVVFAVVIGLGVVIQ